LIFIPNIKPDAMHAEDIAVRPLLLSEEIADWIVPTIFGR
jgi:hypothetical protein